jgi:hypothetical protein
MRPELAESKLMPIVVQNEHVMKYLPDWEPGQKLPSRDFFWHILNKIKRSYMKHLVTTAIENKEG